MRKHSTCLDLRQEVGNAVKHQVDEGVVAGNLRLSHVADDDRDRGRVRLAAQLRDHRRGDVDTADLHPALAQRDGHPTCADGELEGTTAVRQLLQALYRRVEHFRCEHPGAGRVVASGCCLVPEVLVSIRLHGLILKLGAPASIAQMRA